MRELARRPSLLMAIALIVGLFFFEQPLFVLLAVAAFWIANGPGWKLAVLSSFLIGIVLWPSPASRVGDEQPFVGEAMVDSIPTWGKGVQIFQVESGGSRYILYSHESLFVAPGDVIEIKGTLRPLSRGQIRVASLQSVSGTIRPDRDGIKVLRKGPLFFRMGVLWRNSFREFARTNLERRSAAAVNALCFNDTSNLDERTYEYLQRSGTIHIISASGLHVLIFAMGLNFFLGFFPIPRGLRLILIGAMLVLYAIGAGMRPPVIRSVLMAGILGSASYARREPDLLSALGISAFAYLLWRPVHVSDIGFQLSFVTVAALGMFLPLSEERIATAWQRIREGLLQVCKASLVATLASAPLTAYYFGMVSVVSVPANVLIALTLPVLTLSAFFAHGIFGLWPALGAGMMVGIVQPLSGWVLWVVEMFGSLSFAAISVPAFSAWWMVPYYGLMLAFWRPRARPA